MWFFVMMKGGVSPAAVTTVMEHPVLICTIGGDGMRHALLGDAGGIARH